MRSSYSRKCLIDIIIKMDMHIEYENAYIYKCENKFLPVKLLLKLILKTIDQVFFTPIWRNNCKPVKSWISFFSSARLRNGKSNVVRRERGYYVKIGKRLRNDFLVFALRIINVILAN